MNAIDYSHYFTTRIIVSAAFIIATMLGQAQTVPGTQVSLYFRDSVTGFDLEPDTVTVDGRVFSGVPATSGPLLFLLADGQHNVVVAKEGYTPLSFVQNVEPGASTSNNVHLDPVNPPAELRVAEASSLLKTSEAEISGYVCGDSFEGALSKASVTVNVAGNSYNVSVTSRGYYSMRIPVDAGKQVPEDNDGRKFLLGEITASAPGYGASLESEALLVGGVSITHNFRLSAGSCLPVSVDARKSRGRLQATVVDGIAPQAVNDQPAASLCLRSAREAGGPQLLTVTPPTSIRVGQTCSCTACTTVNTMSMDTYVKHVLPAEWISSWNAESLKAGAIAIRSYGAYYTFHPINASYDICDTTCCQVYGTATATSTNNAVNATTNIYLVDGSGNIARAEYSAENNDLANRDGCGDCNIQNKPSDGICLSDSVCCGTTQNGHGRGECQWGTQRWATNQAKTYDWITDHYYSAYPYTRQTLLPGPPAAPTGVSASDGTYTDRVRVT